jgi:3-oxosteroid 1-dehydrogenase
MQERDTKVTRRGLVTSGLALGGAVSALSATSALKAESPKANVKWDYEADIICVGSGAAAITAAATAVGNGDKVIVLEKERRLGGTTAKSGAVHWIPNNPQLRAAGIKDERDDALRFMVRFSYPNNYVANDPTLGIPEDRYKLIEALYDNGSAMVERLVDLGVYKTATWTIPGAEVIPDYLSHVPENKVPVGRSIAMIPVDQQASGAVGSGASFVEVFAKFVRGKGGMILTEHAVTDVVRNTQGEVVGVAAQSAGKAVRVRARKGVVFGTGGFAQNPAMLKRFLQTLPFGSCAGVGSQGDLIPIASRLGAALGNMPNGWWANVPVEQAIKSRIFGSVIFLPAGDSMIYVNKHGKRFVDEYRSYTSRGRAYNIWDSTEEEYPNHISFMVFDQRTVDIYGGLNPLPRPGELPYWAIKADTLDQLSQAIESRLDSLRSHSIGIHLTPDFAANLAKTVEAFNGYAKSGVDDEFGRGKYDLDQHFFATMSPPRDADAIKGQKFKQNRTMYPVADKGPYYAILIGLGVLDTNGGPVVNEHAQIVDYAGNPISGLYGAGNCIAAPSGEAYYGPGGTVGPAMTFGFIASNHAHLTKERSAV